MALALAFAVASCSMSRSNAGVTAAATPGLPDSHLLEGGYAICKGAYEHNESLVIREGTFQHFIQTHGMYGNRSSGTYTLIGDTLVLNVQQQGPPPQGVRTPIPLNYSFVVGQYAGFSVLWRGAREARRMATETGGISQYSALFYGGTAGTILELMLDILRSLPSFAREGTGIKHHMGE